MLAAVVAALMPGQVVMVEQAVVVMVRVLHPELLGLALLELQIQAVAVAAVVETQAVQA